MGFTRETIAQETEKRFLALTIDDGPNGPINLRNVLLLDEEDQKALLKKQKDMGSLAEDATASDLKAVADDILVLVANKREDMTEYLASMTVANSMFLYEKWSKSTEAGNQ